MMTPIIIRMAAMPFIKPVASQAACHLVIA
jgi:hypothetical protein